MDNQILVLGATGKTGKRVVDRLQNKNIATRLGSRNANPSFDWEKLENWETVLKNIEKVYITFQPDLAVPGATEKIQTFVDLAKRSGVRKLVLLSGRGETEAQRCENIVANSGLEYTLVMASWFMQNFSESFFLDAVLQGQIIVPKLNALEPFVDADDIADVVVSALTDDKHSGKTYELTGPEMLSFKEATETISVSINRPIAFREVSMEDYVQMLRDYETAEDFIWLIEYLFTEVLDGRNESLTNDVKKVLGHEPISFNDYVEKTKKAGIWDTDKITA